jgi:hypothetical protein
MAPQRAAGGAWAKSREVRENSASCEPPAAILEPSTMRKTQVSPAVQDTGNEPEAVRSVAKRHLYEQLEQRGVTNALTYDPDWSNLSAIHPDYVQAHITPKVAKPERAPLPVTETGYLSHFLSPDEVEVAGGLKTFIQV